MADSTCGDPTGCYAASSLSWTAAPPTVPGLYWWRRQKKKPIPLEVEFTYGALRTRGCRIDRWGYGGEWAGPLTPAPE
jgi:hypothetical protein